MRRNTGHILPFDSGEVSCKHDIARGEILEDVHFYLLIQDGVIFLLFMGNPEAFSIHMRGIISQVCTGSNPGGLSLVRQTRKGS